MKHCLLFALSVAAILSGQSAFGQVYGERPRQPEAPRERLEASGTVKQLSRGVIQVVTGDGEQWLVQVQAARPQDVSFTGTAEPSFVKPGMWVRFSSRLSKRGEASGPVSMLEIFTPREGYGVGISSGSGGGGEAQANIFSGEAKPAAEKPKADENTVYQIAGQVTKISRLGELTISAGGTSVKAKLADDAKVSLDMGDLTFLRPGDKVELRGWYYAGRKGQAVADQVTASAAEVLADASKKKKPLPSPATDSGEPKADFLGGEKGAGEAKKPPAEGDKKPGEKPAE